VQLFRKVLLPIDAPRVLLITGGSSGIGRAAALLFAALGDHVTVTGRRADRLDALRHEVEQRELPGVILPVVADVTDPEAMRRAVALTLAEFLAFDRDMHVLVIMTDMTNYGEALRELASQRGEVPSRQGYPGYLYSDLASLYERTGILVDRAGSITQVPILTMPNDDINHPIPDLTGYITEGQLVLSRDLFRRGIYPCIDVLPSLSRLMKDGIGEGYTREDHPDVSNQLYAAYAHVQEVRSLAAVIGEEELSETDKRYLEMGRRFEEGFVQQGQTEARTIDQTLDAAWKVLSVLPRAELTRVTNTQLDAHYAAPAADKA